MPRPVVLTGESGSKLTIDGTAYAQLGNIGFAVETDDRLTPTYDDPEPQVAVFSVTSLSSAVTGSFWEYLWDNAGEKNVPVVYAAFGNAVATANEPHITTEIDVPRQLPGMGVEAGTSEGTFEVELRGSRGAAILKVTS